ncbi:MAG: hypothetical protein JNM33_09635 [Rubrivivax sp.]|nr:hypothetical protein [Rubrivivax sp.]
MTTPFAPFGAAPAAETGLRAVLAAALRLAGRALEALAAWVAPERPLPPLREMVYEFYADAGAPEGALYIDGQLVGYLPGVTRL